MHMKRQLVEQCVGKTGSTSSPRTLLNVIANWDSGAGVMMGVVVLRKSLSHTEVQRHTITVPASVFKPSSTVEIIADQTHYRVDVDSYMRLRMGSRILNVLDIENVGDILILEQVKEGVFRASKGTDSRVKDEGVWASS